MSRTKASFSGRWIPVAVLSLCACGELPREELIEYARPLALVAHVVDDAELTAPGPTHDPTLVTANTFLPADTGQIRVLVADPDGTVDPMRIEQRFIACLRSPLEEAHTCIREGLRANASPPPCDDVPNDTMDQAIICTLESDATDSFVFPLHPSLAQGRELTMGYFGGVDRPVADCVEVMASGADKLPDDCLYATHALPLGPPDAVADRLETLGVAFELPEGLPADDRGLNPAVEEIEVRVGSTEENATTIQASSGQEIEVGPDQHVWITVDYAEGSEQPYSEPISGTNEVAELDETLLTRWYATQGEFESILSRGLQAETQWTPDEGAAGMNGSLPADIYAIGRDGRWGGTWVHLRIVARP